MTQHPTSRSSRLPEGASLVGEALQSFMQNSFDKKLSLQQKANRAWYSANGAFEHRHTCGVFLKQDDNQQKPPVLYVYLDNNAIMQDFTTNKDIYLIRLHHAGFELSDIQFRLSKTQKHKSAGTDAQIGSAAGQTGDAAIGTELPNSSSSRQADKNEVPQALSSLEAMEAYLGAEEVARAQEKVSVVPLELREKLYRAMIASLVRQRIHTS